VSTKRENRKNKGRKRTKKALVTLPLSVRPPSATHRPRTYSQVTPSCCGRVEGETRRRLREGGEERVGSRGGARGWCRGVMNARAAFQRFEAAQLVSEKRESSSPVGATSLPRISSLTRRSGWKTRWKSSVESTIAVQLVRKLSSLPLLPLARFLLVISKQSPRLHVVER
jgi:hypothetical protein